MVARREWASAAVRPMPESSMLTRPHGGGQADAHVRAGLVGVAGGDGVDGVLQQLADVDAGAGVEVVGEQVDEAAQVDLEVVGLGAGCGA